MEISRRRALALGLAGVAAAATGSALHLPVAAPGRSVLSAAELDVVGAVALVLFPGVHFPLDGVQAGVPERVDELLVSLMEPGQVMAFRYVIRAIEWGTAAAWGRRFTQLDRNDQAQVLAVWGDPDVVPRRLAADSLKAILSIAYFGHPTIQQTIGWRGLCGVRR